MIKDLGDSLAGRIALLALLPFHIEEQQVISKLGKRLASPAAAFLHACLVGSYPELNLKPEMDRRAWYGAYVQMYLERDIRTLYNIGDLRKLQRFLQRLATRTAQILTLTDFSMSRLKLGPGTRLCVTDEDHALARDLRARTLPHYWERLPTLG